LATTTNLRNEFLAYQIFIQSRDSKSKDIPSLGELSSFADEDLLSYIQKFMNVRYNEGYSKGLHDADALAILKGCLDLYHNADYLIYSASARACAEFFWNFFLTKEEQNQYNLNLKGAGAVLEAFPDSSEFANTIQKLVKHVSQFIEQTKLFDQILSEEAGEYLFYEIARGDSFILSKEAKTYIEEFHSYLRKNRIATKFIATLGIWITSHNNADLFTSEVVCFTATFINAFNFSLSIAKRDKFLKKFGVAMLNIIKIYHYVITHFKSKV
jgi:hypothetical protein